MCFQVSFYCLFYWRKRLERFGFFRTSGHFHVSENGAGVQEKFGRCIFCFSFGCITWLQQRWQPPLKIGRKQYKRTIYLMLNSTFPVFVVFSSDTCNILSNAQDIAYIQLLRNKLGVYTGNATTHNRPKLCSHTRTKPNDHPLKPAPIRPLLYRQTPSQ